MSQSGNGNGADAIADISSFDEHDEAIIANLRRDGRLSNRELAARLGLNEATVRTRIRRMEADDAMRVVAVVDLQAMGFNFIAPVGVQVKGRSAEDVGSDLARIEQVVTVSASIGAQDLEIQLVAKEMSELDELLTNVIPAVPGVARVEASLAMHILKYESPWVPFL
jgi:Lrp/AsnC family transcriptional regulator, regulator for asnA, asnC and gidA